MKNEKDAVEFFKWATELIARKGPTSFWPRVITMQPHGKEYQILNEKGETVHNRNRFLSAEEVYEYYLKEENAKN